MVDEQGREPLEGKNRMRRLPLPFLQVSSLSHPRFHSLLNLFSKANIFIMFSPILKDDHIRVDTLDTQNV